MIETTLVENAYIKPYPHNPSLQRDSTSQQYVEYVVKLPKTPTVSATLRGDVTVKKLKLSNKKPIANEPTILMQKVTHGKVALIFCEKKEKIRNRANVPIIPAPASSKNVLIYIFSGQLIPSNCKQMCNMLRTTTIINKRIFVVSRLSRSITRLLV